MGDALALAASPVGAYSCPQVCRCGGAAEWQFGDGAPLHVLGIGDSIIAGVGVREHDLGLVGHTARLLAETSGRRVHWHAFGKIGADTHDLLAGLEAVRTVPADVVLVSVGVNDLTSLRLTHQWRASLTRLMDELASIWPDAYVVLSGLPPMQSFPLLPQPLRGLSGVRARRFDAIAANLVSSRSRAIHVPLPFELEPDLFAEDGFHPSEIGYALLAGEVSRHLARLPL
ncbi:MAG: SGNH/GDSL hydrolase family protein [Ahniella sp.]|nr:SGNH/GDSL hydrolase family protein [Ahniella sp.]